MIMMLLKYRKFTTKCIKHYCKKHQKFSYKTSENPLLGAHAKARSRRNANTTVMGKNLLVSVNGYGSI